MTNIIRISIALVSLTLAGGCSKKDDKKADPAAKTDTTAPKPAEGTTPTPNPTEGMTPTPPPTTDTAQVSGAFDAGKAEALRAEVTTIFEKSGTDCAKLATDLQAFVDENKDTLKQLDTAEKAMPEADKKAWDAKNKATQEAAVKKAEPAMKACGQDAKVQAAMAGLTGDAK